MTKNALAIILAAGKSERMNFPKSLLPFDDNFNFIEKIIYEYKKFNCNRILCVVNERDEKIIKKLKIFDSKVIVNTKLELGRFYSVKMAVNEYVDANFEYCFLQNIDNPFVNQDVLKAIFENKNENSFTTPIFNFKGGHPILISKNIACYLHEKSKNDSNLKTELNNFNRIKIKVDDEKILANINTKEIYEKYFNRKIDF